MKTIRPPRLADKLFEWYCAHAAVEDLHGDMEELFYKNAERMSARRAKLKYWGQVISLILSYAIKKRKRKGAYHPLSSNANSLSMLRNYFIVATRTLAKQRFFTIINVLGLSIGMSASLLFLSMLSFLSTYDNFHTNRDRIYRVITQTDDNVRNREFASAPLFVADKLKSDFTGIEEVVRINSSFEAEAKNENKEIPLQGYYVDPNFLRVFSFPLLKGNSVTALQKPNTILITEEAGKKMFGEEDPMGKVITMGGLGDFEVAGVLKNISKNSHMRFEVLTSYSTFETSNRDTNSSEALKEFRGNYVYMLLPEAHEARRIEDYLNGVSAKIYSSEENFKATFELQGLNDIVPGPDLYNDIGPEWDYTSLIIFATLTLLILIPACFNYANISISRALKRAKEIGLRKVVGGQRGQIFFQFIVETVIITFIGLVGAYGIFVMVRAEFLSMLVSAEGLDLGTNFLMLSYFAGFALLIGFLSGAVPAIYFSKLNPIQALKNSTPVKSFTGISFRKALIVGQFALSLGFIMAVVVALKQHRSSLNYDFGFTQENILDVELQGVNPQLFRNEFEKLSSIQSVSMSSGVVGASGVSGVWVNEEPKSDSIEVAQMFIDHNYLSNFNLVLTAGRNFSNTGNEKTVIVNEEFLKEFKLTAASALGKTFSIPEEGDVTVLGVVKNFHYASLREPIRSFFFRYDPKQFSYANLKIISTDMASTFSDMEAAWKIFGGELKFKSQFFDDEIEEAYSFYFSMVKICGFLGLLAISISCLGLLGMVVYTAETRTKEIGVRKVMGATTGQLTLLLSKSYLKLMIVAAVIAIPVTYVIMDKMLSSMQHYYSRIGVLEVVVSLGIMLLLGIATIMSQTIKAARSNPVDTLRYE